MQFSLVILDIFETSTNVTLDKSLKKDRVEDEITRVKFLLWPTLPLKVCAKTRFAINSKCLRTSKVYYDNRMVAQKDTPSSRLIFCQAANRPQEDVPTEGRTSFSFLWFARELDLLSWRPKPYSLNRIITPWVILSSFNGYFYTKFLFCLPGGTLTISGSAAYSARGRLLLLARLCFSVFVGTAFIIGSTTSAPLDLDRLNGGDSTRDSDVM